MRDNNQQIGQFEMLYLQDWLTLLCFTYILSIAERYGFSGVGCMKRGDWITPLSCRI